MVDGGVLEVATGGGLDDASYVVVQNRTGAGFEVDAADTVEGLIGGGKGATRTFSQNNAPIGFLMNNYISGTGGNTVLNATLTLDNDTAGRVNTYGGAISGSGGIFKVGRSTLELRGANTYTGQTRIDNAAADNTTSTIRLGVYGAATGLGAPGSGGQGSLSSATSVVMNSATTNRNTLLDLNGASKTVNSLTSTGGSSGSANAVNLGVGSLTIHTNTGTSGVFNGGITGPGNVNVTKTLGTRWDLTGTNSFTGTLNVTGAGTNVRLNRTGGGTLADTARINVGTGATVVVNTFDTIGSISGSGTIGVNNDPFVAPGVAVLKVAAGASGSISAAPFSGSLSDVSGSGGMFQLAGGGLRFAGDNTAFTAQFVIGDTGTVPGRATAIFDYSGLVTDIVPDGFGTFMLGGATVFLRGNSTLNRGASAIIAFPSDTSRLGLGDLFRNAGSALHVAGSSADTNTANTNGIIGGYATFGGAPNPDHRYQATTWAVSNGVGTAISGLGPAGYTTSTVAANSTVASTAKVVRAGRDIATPANGDEARSGQPGTGEVLNRLAGRAGDVDVILDAHAAHLRQPVHQRPVHRPGVRPLAQSAQPRRDEVHPWLNGEYLPRRDGGGVAQPVRRLGGRDLGTPNVVALQPE